MNCIITPEVGSIDISDIESVICKAVHSGISVVISDFRKLSDYSGDDKIIIAVVDGKSIPIYHSYSNATFSHMYSLVIKSLKNKRALNMIKAEKLFSMREEKPTQIVRTKIKESMYNEFMNKCESQGRSPADVIRKLIENYSLSDDRLNIDEGDY